MKIVTQPVNLRLPRDLVDYLESYQKQHGLSNRTEVIVKAIEQLRAQELIEGYKALAQEQQECPDPLAQKASTQGLTPSDETSW